MSDSILKDNQSYSLFDQNKTSSLFDAKNAGSLFGKPGPEDPNNPAVIQRKIMEQEQEAKELGAPIPSPEGKSWSLWDMLNIARQPITEALYTATKEAGEGDINWGDVLHSAVMGVAADLPWLGDKIGPAYKHTSADVIRLMFPDAPEWVARVGGIAGDIITDPLTYLSFGMAGGAKGVAEAGKVGAEFAAKSGATIADEIAKTGVSKTAQALVDQFGGQTWKEALQRAVKQTTQEAGNYGLRLGIPFTDVGTTIAKGGPTSWIGNLLNTVGAPEAGKAVQGLGTTIAQLPVIRNLNRAFNPKADLGPFSAVKDTMKETASQTGLQLEKYGNTLTSLIGDANDTLKTAIDTSPEVAQFFKNVPDVKPDANGLLEMVRRYWDRGMDLPDAIKPIGDKIKQTLDTVGQQLVDRNMLKPEDLLANYFPRYYEKNGRLATLHVQENPLTATFLRDRTFDTAEEAIKQGFKPIDPINSLRLSLDRSARITNNYDMMKGIVEKYGKVLPGNYLSGKNLNDFEKAGFQQLDVPGFTTTVVPSEIADKLNEAYKIVTNPTEATKFLNFMNGIQNMWKKQATVLRPGFHLSNAQSNAWTYAFKDGPTLKNAELYQKATKIWQGAGKEAPLTIKLDGEAVTHSLNDWYEMFRGAGIHTGQFSRADLDAVSRVAQTVPNTAQKILQAPGKAAETAGSFVENTFRIASGLADLNKGTSIADAAKNVNKWFNDYSDLTKTEQSIKKFIPFYTWMRKNLATQFTAMFSNPGKYSAFTIKPLNAIDFNTPEQKQLLPDWQKKGMAINPFGIKDAQGNPIELTTRMPFQDVQQFAQGNPLANLVELVKGGISPLIKLPVEEATNTSLYSNKPIAQNEFSVTPVPAVLDPVVEGIPNVVKDKLGLKKDATGRWNGPAKWVYALSQVSPLMNVLNPVASMAGVESTPYEMQKAPYAIASQVSGISPRPFDVNAARIKAMQQRLQDLQLSNRTALQDKLMQAQREDGVPLQVKLAKFRKYLGL
jgi:hypothetical protein